MVNTREEKVRFLVKSDVDYILSADMEGASLLRHYLIHGFKGYQNFSDSELDEEIQAVIAAHD